MQELATHINKHVAEVCCFGANNSGDALKAKIELMRFISSVIYVFGKPNRGVLIKLQLTEAEQEQHHEIRNQSFDYIYPQKNTYNILPSGTPIFFLPFDLLISSTVIEFVNRVYPLSIKFTFHTCSPESLFPNFAFFMHDLSTRCKSAEDLISQLLSQAKDLQRDIEYSLFYENGVEFIDNHKAFFLQKTFKDVKNAAYLYGIGNCGLMTDVAFAEAVAQEHHHPVTYLRFVCKEDKDVDILNCIALGDWPNTGCMIIAPWIQDGVFEWRGSIENTPRINAVNSKHNEVKVLCRLSPAEKMAARKQLIALGYRQWMSLEQRTLTLAKVREKVEIFLKNIRQVTQPQAQATEQLQQIK